jgi:hypothetical protein
MTAIVTLTVEIHGEALNETAENGPAAEDEAIGILFEAPGFDDLDNDTKEEIISEFNPAITDDGDFIWGTQWKVDDTEPNFIQSISEMDDPSDIAAKLHTPVCDVYQSTLADLIDHYSTDLSISPLEEVYK